MPQSLSARLFVAYLGAWLLTACVVAAGIAWILRGDPSRWYDHSTLGVALELAADARSGFAHLPDDARLSAGMKWLAQAAPLELGYRVFDEQGRVHHWSSLQIRDAWTAAGLDASPMAMHSRAVVGGVALRMRTVRVEGPGAPMWLQLGMSEHLIALLHAGSFTRLGGTIVGTVAVSIVLLGVAQWLVLRRLMQPVRRLSAQAKRLSLDRDSRQMDAQHAPLEIRPLVESINDALRRLEQAYARQVQFLADAAHELKTPLSLLRLQAEFGQPDPQVLVRDIDQVSRQVQQMLLLAEVTEPRSFRDDPIDVAAVAGEVCRLLDPVARRGDVTLQFSLPQSNFDLRGDASALQVLLKNLVENAISFAPRGTAVAIDVDGYSLRVTDRGPGIASAHMPHLFTRFWRAPGRRDSGAGLGLAICQAVAQAHAWQLTVRNLAPGAEFTLHFQTLATENLES